MVEASGFMPFRPPSRAASITQARSAVELTGFMQPDLTSQMVLLTLARSAVRQAFI